MSSEQKKFFHMVTHIPLFFLGMLLVGFSVYWYAPVYIAGTMNLHITTNIGILLLIIGTVSVISAERSRPPFFKLAQIQHCYEFARGLYRFSRHPGTLGFLVMFFGVGCVLNSWSFIIIGIISCVMLTYTIIPPYERSMAALCDTYIEYQTKVRMWF